MLQRPPREGCLGGLGVGVIQLSLDVSVPLRSVWKQTLGCCTVLNSISWVEVLSVSDFSSLGGATLQTLKSETDSDFGPNSAVEQS